MVHSTLLLYAELMALLLQFYYEILRIPVKKSLVLSISVQLKLITIWCYYFCTCLCYATLLKAGFLRLSKGVFVANNVTLIMFPFYLDKILFE